MPFSIEFFILIIVVAAAGLALYKLKETDTVAATSDDWYIVFDIDAQNKYLASGFILLLQFQACITKLRRSLQIQLMLSKQHGAEVKLELTMKYLGFPIHTVVGTGMAFQLIYKGNQILSSTLTLRNI